MALDFSKMAVNMFTGLLQLLAQHGRHVLAASLLIGLSGGALAEFIAPHVNLLIAMLLFTAAMRVGQRQALSAIQGYKFVLGFALFLQLVMPVAFVLIARLFNLNSELTIVIALLLAASPLSGSPNLIALLGHDGASALRQLLVGTAILPLTIFPVLLLLPNAGDISLIIASTLRLLAIITIATACGFLVRKLFLDSPKEIHFKQIDGASTLLLAITVIGLMAAIRQEFVSDPANLIYIFVSTLIACFGLQIIGTLILLRTRWAGQAIPLGVIAGTRNVALFLTAVSPDIAGPLTLFIACYQIPMYLTPIVMRRFYAAIEKQD